MDDFNRPNRVSSARDMPGNEVVKMRVGCVGAGVMGREIIRHLVTAGHDVAAFDLDPVALAAIDPRAVAVSGIADLANSADVFFIIVATDAQTSDVVTQLLAVGLGDGAAIAVLATCHPDTMAPLAKAAKAAGIGFIDAPVCYGKKGAVDGNLLSLCGGDVAVVEQLKPAMMAYSSDVLHVGAIGSGQVAKACNNMMHWAACVANYEVLFMAKSHGINAQHMREILLQCPARNTTLERWDSTNFTWHEKDMDVALDLAQQSGITLPLFGQVDQLVKTLGPDKVKMLLYGNSASYLGQDLAETAADPEK
jgi:3-hydroxyisobutyrate dehydrogenase-like beta-hydroxyacid dehydrogenase